MSKMNSRISEREKKKAREKERFSFDPKIVCSLYQTSTNNQIPNLKLFVKIKQKNPCQTLNINNWFECFWFLMHFYYIQASDDTNQRKAIYHYKRE